MSRAFYFQENGDPLRIAGGDTVRQAASNATRRRKQPGSNLYLFDTGLRLVASWHSSIKRWCYE